MYRKKIFLLIIIFHNIHIVFSKHDTKNKYYENVYNIISKHCLACHHNGGEGKISFETFDKIRNYSKTMQYVINNNIMPPWKADTSYSHFKNERLLNVKEKDILNKWINGGCQIDIKKSIKLDSFKFKRSRYKLEPNLTLGFPKSYKIKAEFLDKFVNIKIPFEIEKDTVLNCIEFIPDNTNYVHHVNFEILSIDSTINLNQGEFEIEFDRTNNYKENRYSIFKRMNLLSKDGSEPESLYYGSWVPGMSALNLDGLNLGIKLPKHGVILYNIIHYGPSSTISKDSSIINFYYKTSSSNDLRFIEHIAIGSSTQNLKPPLVIKPNTKIWFTREYLLKENFTLLYLNPHMHLLGKKLIAFAVDGKDTIPLIKIDNWDFDWQELYQLENAIKLKKGTKIILKGYYDNTIENPRNPFNPPRVITGDDGMQTNGEMLLLVLYGVKSDNEK